MGEWWRARQLAIRPQRHRPSGNATVTVVARARNEAADIARYLRSLLAPDYPRSRLIVVNDDPHDDTPRTMEEIAGRHRD